MKFLTASLTVLAADGSLKIQCIDNNLDLTSEDARNDLADFAALVPVEQTLLKFTEYLFTDDEFAKALAYLHSDEYKSLAAQVQESPEYAAVVDYLKNAELDDATAIEEEIERIRSWKSEGKETSEEENSSSGYLGFVRAIQAILPIDEIKQLQDEKMKEAGDYAKLIRRFHTEEFGIRYCNLITAPATLEWMEKAYENGVDIPSDVEYMFLLYGINLKS